MKAPLVCTHVAEGHKSAVLSVAATDDLMFSSSKGRLNNIMHLLELISLEIYEYIHFFP